MSSSSAAAVIIDSSASVSAASNATSAVRSSDASTSVSAYAHLRDKPSRSYTGGVLTPTSITLTPIGVVRSPYVERFGCPRQPNVTTNTLGGGPQDGRVELTGIDVGSRTLALRGLDGFSYMHVIYQCHLNTGWASLIQPPRGPKVKQGVFATRSPHRPNSIGLSLLKIISLDTAQGVIHFAGGDILDGTPVLDLKPYIPQYDSPSGVVRIGWLDGLDVVNEPDTLRYSPPPPALTRGTGARMGARAGVMGREREESG